MVFQLSFWWLGACLLPFLFLLLHRSTGSQLPSPSSLPLIGNLHQIRSLPHRSLRTLAQRHGPVMLLHFGRVPTVVVSSATAAQEVLKTHDLVFASRPASSLTDRLFYGTKDVVFVKYGDYWRQVRRVCVLHLLCLKQVQSFRPIREEEVALLVSRIRACRLRSACKCYRDDHDRRERHILQNCDGEEALHRGGGVRRQQIPRAVVGVGGGARRIPDARFLAMSVLD